MQNRVLILSVVVIGAIIIGVSLAVQQTSDPILESLVKQQTEILRVQDKIDKKLSNDGPLVSNQTLVAVVSKQSELERRITALESKIEGLTAQIGQAKGPEPQRPTIPPDEYTKVHQIEIGKSPVKGDKNAPVTIVEFVDFQCPFCARFHPVVAEVMEAYPGQVNYMIKNFPLQFHPLAKPAAKAALAAGEQGKYYEMVDLILSDARSLSSEKFEEYAKNLKLNVKKFKQDLTEKDAEYEEIIQNDLNLGQQVEVRGTPTFYLNGRKTIARDLNAFKKEIDPILGK